MHVIVHFQNLASLQKSIKTHTATCVRHVIPLVHMAEEYYLLKRGQNDCGCEPALLLIFDTGYYTVVTGWGELFDIFAELSNWAPTLAEMLNQESQEIQIMAIPVCAFCLLTMHLPSLKRKLVTVNIICMYNIKYVVGFEKKINHVIA